jgi:hypothetical protein
MTFMFRDGWGCQFLEEDLKAPLAKELTFGVSGNLFELAERVGYTMELAAVRRLHLATMRPAVLHHDDGVTSMKATYQSS